MSKALPGDVRGHSSRTTHGSSSNTSHHFLDMVSPVPTTQVVSTLPVLVNIDGFALLFLPPSINGPPPQTVSHPALVLLLLIIGRTRLILQLGECLRE